MLALKNITKTYHTGNESVEALKGINLHFRKNEFVSILGQSGCGKTTMLNIIGGLDNYTSGDLIINGKSTKDFKDRDWDTYRNHSIGFVFQSYNLIPHQSVLSNVELALTLSGVSKEERRKKAFEVLEKVGLKDQANKKPNQMSGGQMQRVAIARALINDPDILLADEPTGALDSHTSIQIMDLLKEIAKDKLVIMVTHNPELAEQYSTRIIKLLDGQVIDDSNPYEAETENIENNEKTDKTFMSFFTALSLSLNNLMTKKGRTFLTAFAGSIGIIGIAMIMSLSNGVQNYIDHVEEETLSSYPIMIQESSMDMQTMMESVMGLNEEKKEHTDGKIYSSSMMGDMMNMLSSKLETNNLEEFKNFIEKESDPFKEYLSAVQYNYKLKINVFNENSEYGLVKVNPTTIMEALGLQASSTLTNMNPVLKNSDVWKELLDNQELLDSQFDIVKGHWPKAYNEVVLLVDKNKEISDYTLYSLGLLDQEQLTKNFEALSLGKEVELPEEVSYTYDELLNMKFKLVLTTDYYDKENGFWVDKSEDEEFMKEVVKNSEEIKIVGIICPSENSVNETVEGGIRYTKDLKFHYINKINESEIAKEQKANKDINVLTGMEFKENNDGKLNMEELTPEQKTMLMNLSSEELAGIMANYQTYKNATYESNLELLGIVDENKPNEIFMFPKDFESKDGITTVINDYNDKQKKNGKDENIINYNDVVGTMMSSVSNIINIISYVLMAFVSVSLIVSSIMIGIITYISVLERTKEIGILRSIGASKKDISRVFNAETFIIGLVAGLLGICVTMLLNIPINMVLENLLDVGGLASLPWSAAVILVVISMVLTVIAGLIPSRVASKKDPVEALRSE